MSINRIISMVIFWVAFIILSYLGINWWISGLILILFGVSSFIDGYIVGKEDGENEKL